MKKIIITFMLCAVHASTIASAAGQAPKKVAVTFMQPSGQPALNEEESQALNKTVQADYQQFKRNMRTKHNIDPNAKLAKQWLESQARKLATSKNFKTVATSVKESAPTRGADTELLCEVTVTP